LFTGNGSTDEARCGSTRLEVNAKKAYNDHKGGRKHQNNGKRHLYGRKRRK